MARLQVLAGVAAALVAAMAWSPPGIAAEPLGVVASGPYAAPGEKRYVLRSAALGHDVQVVVSPPAGPLASAGRKVPTVYALDDGYGIAGPMARMMTWAVSIAPAYVVSIGYPPGPPGHRDDDLLFRPVTLNGVTSGGRAGAFERFLVEELRPFLAARYPMDTAKDILFGHSFGGLFAAHLLADRPDAFAGYVIASPSLWAEPELLPRLKAAAPAGGGRHVFVTVGDAEEPRMVDGAAAVAAALAGPGSTFTVERRTFRGTHISYYPDLVAAAYRALLPVGPGAGRHAAIVLPEAAYARLTGVYGLGDGRTITVTRAAGRLMALMTGSPPGAFQPESPTVFFTGDAAGYDITLTFEGAPDRPAEAVVLAINGGKTRAVRQPTP